MNASVTTSFPIAWSDPSDVERSWRRDEMHSPFCLVPLSQDYVGLIGNGFGYRYERLEVPISMRAQVVNGYLYFSWLPLGPESEHEAIVEQYVASCRTHTPLGVEYWERAVPELRELYDGIAAIEVERLTAGELAAAWDEVWERVQRAWAIHFYAITGPYQVMDDLADFYESVVEKPHPGEALKLIQGTIHELVSVDAGLGRLTELAAASPDLASAVRATPAPSPEQLAELPGGDAFVSELRSFLVEHGHLGQGFDDLALASWERSPRCCSPRSPSGSSTRSSPPSRARRAWRVRPTRSRTASGRDSPISPTSSRNSNGCWASLVRSGRSRKRTTTGSIGWRRPGCEPS